MAFSVLRKTSLALGAGLLLLAAVVVASYRSTRDLVDAAHRIDATQDAIGLVRQALRHVVDVDTGVRGYVITGRQGYLEPYHAAVGAIGGDLQILGRLVSGQPSQRQTLNQLADLVARRLELAAATVKAREEGDAEAAVRMISTDEGRRLNNEIRRLFGVMEVEQQAILDREHPVLERIAATTIWIVTLSGLVAFGLLSGAGVVVGRHLVARDRANQRLSQALDELAQHSGETEVMSGLMDLLQSCASVEEAHPLVGQAMPRLFPASRGALYIVHASRNFVEAAASWGDTGPTGRMAFAPEDCWALRRGRIYEQPAGSAGPLCPHLTSPPPGGYLCAPLLAHAEVVGILHLQFGAALPSASGPDPGTRLRPGDRRARLAAGAAEQIALALAALRMRQSLRDQSIRDPLTGLFNRRYLEESLERELARAIRKRRPFGVLMIDLDHFKVFNDTWGHEAGDAVMRAVAGLLTRRVRAGDIACRYGGEEFVIILPESTIEEARRRAEDLRFGMKTLVVPHGSRPLGDVTLSVGVSGYPDHGADAHLLLSAADAALYEAKAAGRDRVSVAAVEALPELPEPGEPAIDIVTGDGAPGVRAVGDQAAPTALPARAE